MMFRNTPQLNPNIGMISSLKRRKKDNLLALQITYQTRTISEYHYRIGFKLQLYLNYSRFALVSYRSEMLNSDQDW